MQTEHTFKQYDAELEAVRGKVLQMGGAVNALEVAIDEACITIIARRQPTAGDLRMIMMMVKTITDLERIGDEAAKIARVAHKIYESDRMYAPRFNEIRAMCTQVREMLRISLDAFARLDVTRTVEVARQDMQVDDDFRAVTRQLITFMLEDPRTISMSLEVMFIAKAIERMGDHAKNIAEYVVYMVKGKDVRHVTMQEMEKEALQ
jgi:phosphate transport system protein